MLDSNYVKGRTRGSHKDQLVPKQKKHLLLLEFLRSLDLLSCLSTATRSKLLGDGQKLMANQKFREILDEYFNLNFQNLKLWTPKIKLRSADSICLVFYEIWNRKTLKLKFSNFSIFKLKISSQKLRSYEVSPATELFESTMFKVISLNQRNRDPLAFKTKDIFLKHVSHISDVFPQVNRRKFLNSKFQNFDAFQFKKILSFEVSEFTIFGIFEF